MEFTKVSIEQSAAPASFYIWEVPGKNIVVHLNFGVVDRMLLEVMRGFGAIPRRGAEVGGILLGTFEHGEKTIVRVEEFEAIPCEHRRGPSYLLSENDAWRRAETLERWRPGANRRMHVVGCYRSHTRDGMGLSEEDLALFDAHFADPASVFLVVKPFATRVSVAGFFFREAERKIRNESTYLEFPFRRRELGGGTAKAPERGPRQPGEGGRRAPYTSYSYEAEPVFEGDAEAVEGQAADGGSVFAEPEIDRGPPSMAVARDGPSVATLRKSGLWLPLSLVFLLLGVVVGFQTAVSYRAGRAAAAIGDPYSLGLSVTPTGENLHVKWDRLAQAVRNAQRGVLTISDGTYNTAVDLDAAQLQNPSVFYRHSSPVVRFRLEVFLKNKNSVSETLEWRK